MQALRNTLCLGRLVLVWLLLSVSVAVAAPLVNPVSMEVVCSASGIAVVSYDDETQGSTPSYLHCPLCLPLSGPVPVLLEFFPPQTGLSQALNPLELARLQTLLGKPWQARAPPKS